jgi:DNA-binding transcriptional ArsR family regulator
LCSPSARCFDALGNETRLQIVFTLRNAESTVSEIVEQTGIEQSAASHALKNLEQCGLVTVTPEGKHRRYALTNTALTLLALVETHTKTHEIPQAKPCCCHS